MLNQSWLQCGEIPWFASSRLDANRDTISNLPLISSFHVPARRDVRPSIAFQNHRLSKYRSHSTKARQQLPSKLTAVEAAQTTRLVERTDLDLRIPPHIEDVFNLLRNVADDISPQLCDEGDTTRLSMRVAGGWVRDTLRALPEFKPLPKCREPPLLVAGEEIPTEEDDSGEVGIEYLNETLDPRVIGLDTVKRGEEATLDYAPAYDEEKEIILPSGRSAVATRVQLDSFLVKELRCVEATRRFPKDGVRSTATSTVDLDIALGGISGAAFAQAISNYTAKAAQSGMKLPDSKFINVCADVSRSRHLEASRGFIGDVAIDLLRLRAEGYADDADHRVPVNVQPSSPQEDALRRDFTANALFYNLRTRAIEDFHGGKGLSDLKRAILRPPLNPHAILRDDPLRTLRAVRFAAKLNFRLHPGVIAASRLAGVRTALIRKVAVERITAELRRTFQRDSSSPELSFLYPLGLIRLLGVTDAAFPLYPFFLSHISKAATSSRQLPPSLKSLWDALVKKSCPQAIPAPLMAAEKRVITELSKLDIPYSNTATSVQTAEQSAISALYLNQRTRRRSRGFSDLPSLSAVWDSSVRAELHKVFPAHVIDTAMTHSTFVYGMHAIRREFLTALKTIQHIESPQTDASQPFDSSVIDEVISDWLRQTAYGQEQARLSQYLAWYKYQDMPEFPNTNQGSVPSSSDVQVRRWQSFMKFASIVERWAATAVSLQLADESVQERENRWPLLLAGLAWAVSSSAYSSRLSSITPRIPLVSTLPFPANMPDEAYQPAALTIEGQLKFFAPRCGLVGNLSGLTSKTHSLLYPSPPSSEPLSESSASLKKPSQAAAVPLRPLWAWWRHAFMKFYPYVATTYGKLKLLMLQSVFPPLLTPAHGDTPVFSNQGVTLPAVAAGLRHMQQDGGPDIMPFLGQSSSAVALRSFMQEGVKESTRNSDYAVTILLGAQWLAHTLETEGGKLWTNFFDMAHRIRAEFENLNKSETESMNQWIRRWFPAPSICRSVEDPNLYVVDLGLWTNPVLPLIFLQLAPVESLRSMAMLAQAIMDEGSATVGQMTSHEWLQTIQATVGVAGQTKCALSGSVIGIELANLYDEHRQSLSSANVKAEIPSAALPLVTGLSERLILVQKLVPDVSQDVLRSICRLWVHDVRLWLDSLCNDLAHESPG